MSRLADRLSEERHRRFVGRIDELRLFHAALTAESLPFHVLHMFGPGGVGKTTLLQQFLRVCVRERVPAAYLDARNADPSPEGFRGALSLTLGLGPEGSLLEALAAQGPRSVVCVDTYETLNALDSWLRQSFLPQLPPTVLLVFAGRNPPAPGWQMDPGWQALTRSLPLRNLSPEESRAYLSRREVPAEQHEAVLDFTHGHPLALSLVADVFAQRPDTRFQRAAVPDVVRALVEHLVQKVPSASHRAALEACALVRLTTEDLLAELLTVSDAHDLFTWLRSLSFVEAGPVGLFPHDLAREALIAELRWRNPDWYAELHRRARTYYGAQLQRTRGLEQQRIMYDYIFLHRDNPAVRPFYRWEEAGAGLPDAFRDTDRPALLGMVARHEGAESARLAAHWLDRQPQGTVVFREAEPEPTGFLMMVALHQATDEDIRTDPAAQQAWAYLRHRAPLRPGEGATLFRFWMAREAYQAVSPVQSLIFVNAVRHYLTAPGLAFTFFPCAEPDFWAPLFAYAQIPHIPEADFEAGGRRYGVYGHDWRAVPPGAWLAMLAEREIETGPPVQASTAPEEFIALSHDAFLAAVRDALRDLARPGRLRRNPLLRSRLVLERVSGPSGEAKRAAILQGFVKEAAEVLQASRRGDKLHRALYHAYLHPAPSQERAAELLDVPFSTFRRHLKAAVDRVAETLWEWEIGAATR